MASKKFFTKDRVYPLAVISIVGLIVLFALLLSGNGLNRFLSPLDQTNGSPNIILKAADNDTSPEHKTLINNLGDVSQDPVDYLQPDVSNEIMPTPPPNSRTFDMFRIQGRIEVVP